MRSKRMLMGAAVIGCLAAAMTSGAYAQDVNTTDQLKAHGAQQPAASARTNSSIQGQGQGANANAQLNAGAKGNTAMSANGQPQRRRLANESRMDASARAGRGYAERRPTRGERGASTRVSQERFGRRGERGLYASARPEGNFYRGGRVAYRNRAVGAGVGFANYGYRHRRLYAYAPTWGLRASGSRTWGYRHRRLYAYAPTWGSPAWSSPTWGYRHRRLYAYAPTYQAGVATAPRYSYRRAYYGRGYNLAMNTGPYYAPAWNVAYAEPSFGFGPGFGIGIGPFGIGFGPAWGWW